MLILFRQVTGPVPPNWEPGFHWQVEAHADDCDLSHPLGVAWVTATPEPPPEGMVRFVSLDFVLVPDQHRRRGVATRLVAACRERWPDVWLTDAVSEAGQALLDSLGSESGAE